MAAQLDPHRRGKVGVLYGALPPATRRDVIARFTRGELEVLVTTDVIGHGINVPATTVLFAETQKFDGTEMRPLRTWEAAQIAGRAGRYGLTGHGQVGVLGGVAGLKPVASLVAAGAAVARGDVMSDLPHRTPRLRPELDDLGAFEAVDLPEALTRWSMWARTATETEAMTPDDVSGLVLRVHALLPMLRGPLATDLWTVWRLINLAIDHDPPRKVRWLALARAALQHEAGLAVSRELVLPAVPRSSTVQDYEQAAAQAREAQTLLRSFPGVGRADLGRRGRGRGAVRRPDHRAAARGHQPVHRGAVHRLRHRHRAVVHHLPGLRHPSVGAAGRRPSSAPLVVPEVALEGVLVRPGCRGTHAAQVRRRRRGPAGPAGARPGRPGPGFGRRPAAQRLRPPQAPAPRPLCRWADRGPLTGAAPHRAPDIDARRC